MTTLELARLAETNLAQVMIIILMLIMIMIVLRKDDYSGTCWAE